MCDCYNYEETKAAQIPPGFDGNKHYTSRRIQPWDAMEEWLTPEQFNGFLLGNAIKYLGRCNHKGSWTADLNKAKHYIEKLLEERNGKNISNF